jgi:anti-anti-sigma factor
MNNAMYTPTSLPSLEQILDTCPSIVYVYDVVEQRNVYANRELAPVLGYSVVEIQAMGSAMFVTLMHPDDLARLPEHHAHILAAQDGEVQEFEYRMRHRDGEWRWLVSRDVIFTRTDTGQVQQYLGIVEDITVKRQALDWAQRALSMTPLLVYVYDIEEQRNIYENGQINDLLGYQIEELRAMGSAMIQNLMHPDDFAMIPGVQAEILQADDTDILNLEYRMCRKDQSWAWLRDRVRVFFRAPDGRVKQYMGAIQDITVEKEDAVERASLQQQVIEAQQIALRELSTPLIPLSDNVVIMPLIGSIDSQRAHQVMETLLEGVAQHHAAFVILDITGVQVVDTHVANVLIRAAQAIKLLGAQTILTGIQPAMAQTLVNLGVDLSQIMTRSTLQSGIAFVLNRQRST